MIYTFDSREIKPGMGFVALKGEKVDGHEFIPAALAAGATEIIDGLEALQAKAKAKRLAFKGKVIGVTGSAGKTTTKEFLKCFLKCPGTEGNFNNHIGLPMTILNAPEDADFLVLEMGTNHPGEIAALCDIANPDIGVLVSVGTAHIEFFHTREGIEREKMTLLNRARDFGLRWDSPDLENPPFLCPLPGEHNLANMRLAYNVARRLGVSAEECALRLQDFKLPGSRWRLVEKWGVTFIDDTYNANPDSMIAALDTFAKMPCDGKHVAVLGDMFELGERSEELHRKVFDHAMALKLPLVIGVGEMSSKCLCHCVYKELKTLKKKFRLDVSAGDLVLLKASHSMHLGELLT